MVARWPLFLSFALACNASQPVVAPSVSENPDSRAALTPTADASPVVAPSSDGGAAASKPLFVHEAQADCEGEGPMKCLQVRASEDAEWTLYYGVIEGFSYEPGHRYQLLVTSRTEGGPMDGPSRKVRLVEIVSKRKVR